MSEILPEGFEELEPFVGQFALPATTDRAALRGQLSEKELSSFHQAMTGRIGAALELMDSKPLADLSPQEKRLLDLTLSYAHVALAVEVHGEGEPEHAKLRDRMKITRSPTDTLESA